MSGDTDKDDLPTNEEIIEDLTSGEPTNPKVIKLLKELNQDFDPLYPIKMFFRRIFGS